MTATSSAPEGVAGKQLVHDFLAAMNRMDVDAIGALLTEDATWTMPGDLPVSGRHEGRDAVLGDFLAKAAALFEPGSLRFELETVLTEGRRAIAEYAGTGRAADGRREHRNHYRVHRATGRPGTTLVKRSRNARGTARLPRRDCAGDGRGSTRTPGATRPRRSRTSATPPSRCASSRPARPSSASR